MSVVGAARRFAVHGDLSVLRQATRADVVGMHRVRLAVRENRLTSVTLDEADYVESIEGTGRGWVIERSREIVAFAVADGQTGNVWALFVHPDHEGRGYGRRLHDELIAWLWSRGVERAWLTTSPGTRAQRFYERAGWTRTGSTDKGEIRYELSRSTPS